MLIFHVKTCYGNILRKKKQSLKQFYDQKRETIFEIKMNGLREKK